MGGTSGDGRPFTQSLQPSFLPAFIVIEAGRIISVDSHAGKLLGVIPNSIGRPEVSSSIRDALLAVAMEVQRNQGPIHGRQMSAKRTDGDPLRLAVSGCALPGGSNVVLVLQEWTASDLEARPLWQLDRLASFGLLAAAAAHEIKNAMVPCRTFVDLLLEKEPGTELAGIVSREMKRIQDLLSGLSQASVPAQEPRRPVHVHELLNQTLRLVEPQLADKSIRAERRFEAAVDVVEASGDQLKQAFLNLLLNGIESVSENGRVEVQTRIDSGQAGAGELAIVFADNGIGIPPEDVGHVFQPFFTTKPEGTGLGLPIARQIAVDHGGRVTVESKPGQGSCFTMWLPARTDLQTN